MTFKLSLTENISIKKLNADGAFLIDIRSNSNDVFKIETQLRIPATKGRALYNWLGGLYDEIDADEQPRAHIVRNTHESDRLEIEGVHDHSVYVDYYYDEPRIIVYEPGREEPRHLIDLPSEEAN